MALDQSKNGLELQCIIKLVGANALNWKFFESRFEDHDLGAPWVMNSAAFFSYIGKYY